MNEYNVTDDLEAALKQKNWLGALSIKFERVCRQVKPTASVEFCGTLNKKQMDKVRKIMAKFVNDKFPEKFKIGE